MSATAKPARQLVVELRDQRAALLSNRERLVRTIRDLAADLATSRRDCRNKQREIDSLKVENAWLLAASCASAGLDDEDTARDRVTGKVHELGTRRHPREHTLEWMSRAVLVLRRGNLALNEENASLRLELARLSARDARRLGATPADDRDGRGLPD